ncbi:hypothetical protein JOF56_009676 [Kibdelosporangium banguiense]|uniref:Uncharacterized protein n=1 Tax=Kibdelosporangium banguiense TaxID=1365924 RepID=A0ABS4TZF0_9PSEU|nr:AMED_5909 family protein [Kibdelosporangium banguiense]MBP2329291.1 hypothetical protein [Kibdelosporangium banguiense]
MTLSQANSVLPVQPADDAGLDEKRAFYEARAAMYRRVSESDPDHYWEALACAGLEQEKADEFAEEARNPEIPQ